MAKLGSPLAIGLGNDEYFIANDVSPFIDYTNIVIYLEDLQIAILKRGEKSKLRSMQDDHITDYYIEELAFNLEQIEKGGYYHFTLKEIFC